MDRQRGTNWTERSVKPVDQPKRANQTGNKWFQLDQRSESVVNRTDRWVQGAKEMAVHVRPIAHALRDVLSRLLSVGEVTSCAAFMQLKISKDILLRLSAFKTSKSELDKRKPVKKSVDASQVMLVLFLLCVEKWWYISNFIDTVQVTRELRQHGAACASESVNCSEVMIEQIGKLQKRDKKSEGVASFCPSWEGRT
jgi:hypothetical protein